MMSLGAQAPSMPRALGHLAPCRDTFPQVASRIARVVAGGGSTASAASLRKATDLLIFEQRRVEASPSQGTTMRNGSRARRGRGMGYGR